MPACGRLGRGGGAQLQVIGFEFLGGALLGRGDHGPDAEEEVEEEDESVDWRLEVVVLELGEGERGRTP